MYRYLFYSVYLYINITLAFACRLIDIGMSLSKTGRRIMRINRCVGECKERIVQKIYYLIVSAVMQNESYE